MRTRTAIASLCTLPLLVACSSEPRLDLSRETPESLRGEQLAWEAAHVNAGNIRQDLDTLAAFGTRHTLSDTESDTRGIGAARRWLKQRFEEAVVEREPVHDLEPASVYFDRHTVPADGRRVLEDTEIVNVVCEFPGADPARAHERVYVIAHYDSRASGSNDFESDAPGANDDGSGTVALLELARCLSELTLPRTVVLMAVAGEEQGLYGARAHAAAVADDPNIDVVAVLSNDIIGDPTGPDGRRADDEVRVFSEGLPAELFSQGDRALSAVRFIRSLATEHDAASRQLARYVEETAELLTDTQHPLPVRPRLIFRPDRFLRGGDHTAFNEVGVPAVRFTEVHENYNRQHQDVRVEDGVQYGDLPEYVDEDYVAGVARLNLATALRIASAPPEPTNVRVITARLTNDTTLRWDPVEGAAAYELLWRATTDHTWTHAMRVGQDATEATVPLSKDNWFFAVRSVSDSTDPSLPVIPRPARE